MRAVRRILLALAAAALLWLALLVVGTFALRGPVARRIEARVAAALDADVTVESVSLNLFTGRATVRGLEARRDHGGAVSLDVARVDVKLAPLGLMVLDRDVRRAAADGVRLELSARGVHDLARRPRKRRALDIDDLVVTDARLAVVPTALLPRLGRVELTLARARAADVRLADGLTWLARVKELDAKLVLPGFTDVTVGYRDERLRLSGAIFGSEPLSISFQLPPPEEDEGELAYAARVARSLVKELGVELMRRRLMD